MAPRHPANAASLAFDQVPSFQRTDSITAYWRKLLRTFAAHSCDSFSLSEINSAERAQQIFCFDDLQLEVKDRAVVHFEWDTPAAGRRQYDEALVRFRLNPEVIGRLTEPQFHYWSVTNDNYPVDRLYFFDDADLVVEAEPNELAILFYNLTPARHDALRSLDPDVARTFDSSRNWTATIVNLSSATDSA